MVKRFVLSAGLIGLLGAESPLLAQDQPRQQPVIGYFLPRARVDVVVNQLLRACPTAAHPDPVIETETVVNATARPDPAAYVRLDARSHFLSGRSTKIGLRNDGTLSSFNVTTTGEGGEVVAAVIGVAATVAGSFVGVPILPPTALPIVARPLTCKPETAASVQHLADVEDQIASLRARIARDGATGTDTDVLAALTAENAALIDQLTLTSRIPFYPTGNSGGLQHAVAGPHYADWFKQTGDALQAGLHDHHIGGQHGVVAIVTPDPDLLPLLAAGEGVAPPSTPSLDIYYRRPVPASVRVSWCLDVVIDHSCHADEGALKSQAVLLPQLSGWFSLPVGRGSIFGTRSAAATFDEQGAPLTLEYGATQGGSAIASAITAGGTAFTTLRDAGTAAITRRYTHDKALSDLNALNADPHAASAAQP